MTPLRTRPALLLVLMGLLAGCTHRVHVDTDPVGARLSYRGKAVGVAPMPVEVTWVPFARMPLEVSLDGQRSTTINLQRDLGPLRLLGELLTPWHWDRWWGAEVRSQHEVMMIERHGRAGTWLPEDAKR